jgi:hypothetical protein
LLPVAGCALALGIFAPAASADPVTYVLNSDNLGIGSLRDAMAAVDPGGEVVFDNPDADPVLTGQILISKDVTITGLGAGTSTISGGSQNRVFELATGVTVTIRDLEITAGNAPDGATGATPGASGVAGEPGGAILNTNSNSSLTLTRTRVDGNSAGAGGNGGDGDMDDNGGAGADGGDGGAIFSDGTLVVQDSEISDNQAGAAGAPGANGGFGTTGPNGPTGANGGGIAASGNVTVSGSTISDNSAGDGGSGQSNSHSGDGGDGGNGGGLQYGGGGALTLTNSTITGNEAGDGGPHGGGGSPPNLGGNGGSGGGLFTGLAPATATNATIAGNTAGTGSPGTNSMSQPTPPVDGKGGGVSGATTLNNTIVSSNNAPDADRNCDNAVLDGDHNVSFPDVPESGCPAGFAHGDPLLGALAANGGATPTMAIPQTSSAFDHVPTSGAGCPGTDQRGVTRPQFALCDAGAFELESSTPPPPTGGDGSPPPTTTPATGQRAAALKKCKKKKSVQARKKCKKKANKLPV